MPGKCPIPAILSLRPRRRETVHVGSVYRPNLILTEINALERTKDKL